MRVRFFGVRGSCPTPGPATVRYGGNSVCVEVTLADDTRLVLDAGTGARELGNTLARERYAGPIHMLITHAHWDHIMGLPFFGPLYNPHARITVHPMSPASRKRWQSPILFDGVHFPVKFTDLPAKLEAVADACEHQVSSARITSIELNHPGGALGFRIDDADGTSLCYLTDNELNPPGERATTPDDLARFARGASLVIHDAQYLPADMPAKRGWGHSLVDEVLELGRAAECRALALHHHDPDRDDDALDAVNLHARAFTAAHAPHLDAFVAREGESLDLATR